MSKPRQANRGRAPLSRSTKVLHEASIERMEEAELLFDAGRHLLCMYTAGLAVECLLQAFASLSGAAHDARHDLRLWLDKCPAPVVDELRAKTLLEWSRLGTHWSNDLRYLSEPALRGWLRRRELDRGIRGGAASVTRTCARRCLDSARIIHNKGLLLWQTPSSRS